MNIREKLGLKPKATPQFGQSRSHAMNASKKMFKPNIQNKTVIIDGKKYKVKLTTREIRTLDKKGINLLYFLLSTNIAVSQFKLGSSLTSFFSSVFKK